MFDQLHELRRAWRICGARGAAHIVTRKVMGGLRSAAAASRAATGARVLEVGGPSAWFRPDSPIAVYELASRVDNVNFAGATLWEADLEHLGPFCPTGARIGTQYLLEATVLSGLSGYDLVISAHTIEHTADPLRALKEWRRVTRHGGTLVLVLPHRDGTFDHRRPVTTLEHLLDDEARAVDESDATHGPEILELHDVDRDPGLESREQLRTRVADNASTRAMHHHVFDSVSAWAMVRESGWSPQTVEAVWPHDIVLVASNGGPEGRLSSISSPFVTDRGRRP